MKGWTHKDRVVIEQDAKGEVNTLHLVYIVRLRQLFILTAKQNKRNYSKVKDDSAHKTNEKQS